MRKQKIIGIVIIIVIVLAILGINNRNIFNDNEQVIQDKQQIKQENLTIDEKVDQIVESMSQTEKLGQMVMIGIQGTKVDDDSLYMLNQYHMGGVILFDRNMENPEQVKQLTSDLQAQSNEKVPLFIGIDEEGGDVVRMAEKLTPPPSQKEIGATGDIEQAKTWAIKTAKSLKDMGINVNFAPVADVGSNDKRSYSTDTNTVIDFVRAATKGYQQENIIYSLKHFPGIGKGKVDSHVDSSSIDVAKEVLMTEDIIPFKTIIDENEILFIKRDGMKLIFHTKNRDYETYSSFNKIQDSLPSNFVRAHKSFIVNINNIVNLDPVGNIVYFGDNSNCDIGPKYKKDLMEEVKKNGIFK